MKMNAPFLTLFFMAATLGGCSLMHSPESGTTNSQQPSPKERFVVGQGTPRGYVEYIACLEGQACDTPSTKYLQTSINKPANTDAPLPAGTSHRVHFEWSKSVITPSERARLESFAAGRLRDAKEIVIRGGTDPTGPEAFNLKLTQRRADAVKQELIRLGGPKSRIKAIRHSPCCEQPPNSGPMTNQDLRRADIEIEIFTGTKK